MSDEDGGVELSLRAVAREAGVSTAAPYQHFPDRISLLPAIAASGYREFMTDLVSRHPEHASAAGLADLAVAYIEFATHSQPSPSLQSRAHRPPKQRTAHHQRAQG